MSYNTLLTVSARPDHPVMDAAITLARRLDAHLDVMALGILRTEPAYYYGGASSVMFQATHEQAMEDARSVETALKARLSAQEIRWGIEGAVTQTGGIPALVGNRARFSDLAVLPLPYAPGSLPADAAIVDACLFDGRAPVLLLPGNLPPVAARIVIAWNRSPEAMAAIRAALPLLQSAGKAGICVIDPPAHGPDRSDPGGLLAQWLARHGVRAEVAVIARTLPRVSDVLLRHATDAGADLLVMGAYGHSRFREAILGGATRDLLEGAPLPVLMAH